MFHFHPTKSQRVQFHVGGRMALFPLPLPASSPSPPPPPSAGWSLISAGKGQKEGERGTEAGREGGEIKGGKLAGSPTKTRRQEDGRTAKMLTKSESDRAGNVTVWSGDGSIKEARSIWHRSPLTHGANDRPTQSSTQAGLGPGPCRGPFRGAILGQ